MGHVGAQFWISVWCFFRSDSAPVGLGLSLRVLVGWQVVSLQQRCASFRIVWKRIFRSGLHHVEHPEPVDTASIQALLYHISAGRSGSMPLLVHEIFVPLHFLRGLALNGCWCILGTPWDPKVKFWVSAGYRAGYRSGECLGPGNFDNRTCAVQEYASTTFDSTGSAKSFFALLCATHLSG